MRIVGKFYFAGAEVSERNFQDQLNEVYKVISSVSAAESFGKKISKEAKTAGKELYSPTHLNEQFKTHFSDLGWSALRIPVVYSEQYYLTEPSRKPNAGYREMDFLKKSVGVEVQFGKYAFMAYNVCAKMTIFKNQQKIAFGVEIVPVDELAKKMSSGVSFFEQIVWDLENRGTSNIDVPVIILGVSYEISSIPKSIPLVKSKSPSNNNNENMEE